MKRKIFRAVIVLLALMGIVLIVIRFLPITYKGLALPRPPQVEHDITMPRPSPAWLIVGDKAVLASHGSSCLPVLIFGMGCGTMPEPRDLPDLATAVLPTRTPAVVVIASTTIKEFHATVRPWTEGSDSVPSTIHELKTEIKRGINKTIFVLEPLSEAGDLLLEITITYYQGGASYFWRLNPAPVSALPLQSPTPSFVPTITPDLATTPPDSISVTPLVTAPFIQFASWSPDNQWVAYWISSQEDVEQPRNAMPDGTLNFMNVLIGESCAVSQFVTPNNQASEIYWSDDIDAIVVTKEGEFTGKPCQPEPYVPLVDYMDKQPLSDPALSPGGQYLANTLLQSSEGGILTFETTITKSNSAQPLQRVIWQIDERLGEYGLGGGWISPNQFLLHETLTEGPLILDVDKGVISVATELFGLQKIPSIVGPDEYGLQAIANPGVERDSFHLLLQYVGMEANFPSMLLYHAENGLIETLPFRYVWLFSADGQWLFMDERPEVGGYESHAIWIRRVEEAGGDWEMFANDVDSAMWTTDWTQMALTSDKKVTWQTFPEAERIGQWSTGDFVTQPLAWSPNGRFLVTIGNIPGDWKYGMFVLEP